MADQATRLLALTQAAKQMGMDDKAAQEYSKSMDREARAEERDIAKEQREWEHRLAQEQLAREDRIAREQREVEKEVRLAEIAAASAEREREREHAIRMRELELQATTAIHPSPANSSAHPPPEASQQIQNLLLGVGNFSMPAYRESETIDNYIDKFAKLAESYQLPKDKWNIRLSQGLTGAAYEVFLRLPPGQEEDFECLKTALLQRYELTSSAYRQKFRSARRMNGESVAQFLTRIRGYLIKYHTMGGYESTVTGWQELLLAEQLRETLPKQMQTFLAEQGAERLDAMILLAERYIAAHGDHTSSKTTVQSPTKKPPTSPTKSQGHAGGKNHHQTQHHHTQQPAKNKHRKPWCPVCRVNTHYLEHCLTKATPRVACLKVVKSPPKRKPMGTRTESHPPVTEMATVNGTRVTTLYDTGLQFDAVVSKELIRPNQLTNDTIEILGITRSVPSMTLPIALIQVQSKYVTGTIPAAVIDDPVYSLIIGSKYLVLGEPKSPVKASAVTRRAPSNTYPDPEAMLKILPQEMREAQAADTSLKPCFIKLGKTRSPPQPGDFFIKNSLLYRRSGTGDNEHNQLVVPTSFREQVISLAHVPSTGHVGNAATNKRIASHYFWPGMRCDIHKYVKSCTECQSVAPRHPQRADQPIHIGAMVLPTRVECGKVAATSALPLTPCEPLQGDVETPSVQPQQLNQLQQDTTTKEPYDTEHPDLFKQAELEYQRKLEKRNRLQATSNTSPKGRRRHKSRSQRQRWKL